MERRLKEHTAEDMLIFFVVVYLIVYLMILKKHKSFRAREERQRLR